MSKRRRDQSSAAPDAGVVRLNVGGTIYTTTLDTLRSVPDSLFGRMFDPDISLGMVPTDEDGNIFFDRDPEVFRWVLDFLRRRGRCVGLPRPELIPLLRDEADYFGLVGLVEACDADQVRETKAAATAKVAAARPIVTMLDQGFAGLVTTMGKKMDQLMTRISDDSTKSVTEVLHGIEQSLDAPINYKDELEQISAHLEHIGNHIYDPHGRDDLYSAIRGE